MSALARTSLHAGLYLLLITPVGLAAAADRGPIENDLEISLGAFFMSTNTQLRVDGQNNRTGTEIDLERDLGIEDKDRFRIDAFWRFAKHHKVRLMFYENNRVASRTLDREIHFGDTTFPVNAGIEAELDTMILELAYEYAFLKNDTVELSGSIGIHDMQFSATLSGFVTAGNAGYSARDESEASVNGPLPVIGLHLLWRMGGNFYLDALVQAFKADIENIDGRLYDYKVAANWYPMSNIGIGVGYNDFVTKIDVDKESFTGRLRFDNGGLIAFLIVSF